MVGNKILLYDVRFDIFLVFEDFTKFNQLPNVEINVN